MARRRFFVDEVRGGQARMEGDDAHHLTRVLRVEVGQQYEISDNHDVYLARIEEARKSLVTFAIIDRLAHEDPLVRVTLYASLIRFERLEWLLEKATELGVAKFVPVDADRSEKGLDRASLKRMPRWNRIVREASEQSRRAILPEVAAPCLFDQALAAQGLRLALDEDRTAEPILSALPADRVKGAELSVLAGPEGGWTDRERSCMRDHDWRPVSLGPTILKTETAVLAALAVINAAWQAAA